MGERGQEDSAGQRGRGGGGLYSVGGRNRLREQEARNQIMSAVRYCTLTAHTCTCSRVTQSITDSIYFYLVGCCLLPFQVSLRWCSRARCRIYAVDYDISLSTYMILDEGIMKPVTKIKSFEMTCPSRKWTSLQHAKQLKTKRLLGLNGKR